MTAAAKMESQTNTLQDCIELCWECRNTCQKTLFNHCLQMGGQHVESAHVKLMVDCMEICQSAADFMVRNSVVHKAVCRACADICDACAESCAAIGGDEMLACAQTCRACGDRCRMMAG